MDGDARVALLAEEIFFGSADWPIPASVLVIVQTMEKPEFNEREKNDNMVVLAILMLK